MPPSSRPALLPHLRTALLLLALGLTACASTGDGRLAGAPPPSTSARVLAITEVTVIDVTDGSAQPDVTVLVRDGRIAQLGPRLPVPADAQRLDGRGRFLVPGLWDMHTHHQATGPESLGLFVAQGVVGTRDMGSDADFILPLRDAIAQGARLGPTIVAAGPMLDAAPPAWPWRQRVEDATQARDAARALHRRGVDFLKVHDTTPREAYAAVAAEAATLGLPFAGHVPATVPIAEAARSGQRSIEHLANYRLHMECSAGPTYKPEACAPLFDTLAQRSVWQTPTLAYFRSVPDLFGPEPTPAAHAAYASAGLRRLWDENRAASRLDARAVAFLRAQSQTVEGAVLRDLHARGVPLLAGCDGLVPGFCLHDELEAMVRAGLTPLQALQTATLQPARYLGREAHQGTVAPGKVADLVLLEADPRTDVRNTRRIAAVILRGRPFSRAQLDALLTEAQAAAGATP